MEETRGEVILTLDYGMEVGPRVDAERSVDRFVGSLDQLIPPSGRLSLRKSSHRCDILFRFAVTPPNGGLVLCPRMFALVEMLEIKFSKVIYIET